MTDAERKAQGYQGDHPKVGWLIAQLQQWPEDAEVIFLTDFHEATNLLSIYSTGGKELKENSKFVYIDFGA